MLAKTKLYERHLGAGVTGRPPRGPGTFRRGLSSSCVFSNRSWLTGAGMTTTIKRRRVIEGRGKLDVGDRGRAQNNTQQNKKQKNNKKQIWHRRRCLVFQ